MSARGRRGPRKDVTNIDVARLAGVSPGTVARVLAGKASVAADKRDAVLAAVRMIGSTPKVAVVEESPPKQVTAQDVAELAGVSAMTVSRVMSGQRYVSAAAHDAVMAAAEKLNYSLNVAARSLAGARQDRLGLVYANPSAAFLNKLLASLLSETSRRGAQLLIECCEAGNTRAERGAVRHLIEGGVSALLLPPPMSESTVMRGEAARANVPIVNVAAGRFSGDVSCVRIDNRKAAYDVTRKIIDLGHSRIGFIKGDPNQSASAERLAGFEAAIRDYAPKARKLTAQGFFSYHSGLLAAEQLLGGAESPTAIFAANDDMAAAVVSVAHRRGLDVPRDVTVVGFDDTAIATTLWPELTTVHQPLDEMARNAVEIALREARAREENLRVIPSDIVVKHTLIDRHSMAKVQRAPSRAPQDG